jgi:hypothetical protein
LVLYQIRHFAAVAETGSFTKAATSLRTETSDMTILCFALSNDRVRTRDESRFFALTNTRAGQCPGAGCCLRTFSLPDRILQTIDLARLVGRDILVVQRS